MFCALTCRCWYQKVISSFTYALNQTLWNLWASRRQEENILMGCAFLRVDNSLSSLAAEIICLAVRQVLSPTHTMTHFGENWGGWGQSEWRHYPRPPWRGVRFWEIVDLVDCISLAPQEPPMWLSCSGQCAAFKGGSASRRRRPRLAQRARIVWVLSLTTRAAPPLDLMDPTYAVITMPTGCQLWCGEAFVLRRNVTVLCWSVWDYNKSPPQRSHQSKCFSSSQRSFDLAGGWGPSHWHLIVKLEYIKIRGHPSPGQIKGFLLGLDKPHTKSVGSCSLVDFRGLSREKEYARSASFLLCSVGTV